jgi:hypothetical protein
VFWLFWQLVGVVLGLLAIFAAYWTIVLLFRGAVLGLKGAALGIWKYREVILWTLAVILISGGAFLDGGLRLDIIGWGAVFLIAAVVATAKRHRKNRTIPLRCKCGAWVHLGKCPRLTKTSP